MSKDKDIIPKEYRNSSGEVSMSSLEKYMRKHEITPEEALSYIMEASRIDPSHPRTEWKLFRFTLYLWERLKEFETNTLGKKKDTCLKVVNSNEFKKLYNAYSFNPKKINEMKEADNLFKLVGDVRQRPFFKTRFYKFKNSKDKHLPQELIDKIR